MSKIGWCIIGSLVFSILELLLQRQSFRAAWRSFITWLLIILFCSVNALLANLMSYFVYETTIVIDSNCNTTFSEFIKVVPESLKYFLGGFLLYPAFLNLKITEIASDVGKTDIGIVTIYNIVKDFIFGSIADISVDYKYEKSEKYMTNNPNKSFDDLCNEARTKIQSNTRMNDTERDLILEKLNNFQERVNRNSSPTSEQIKQYKRNMVYLILFDQMLD